MSWIIPALIAPLLGAIASFIDKYLVSRRIPDYRAMPFYFGILDFCIGIFLWLALGFPPFKVEGLLFGFAAGFISAIASFIYYSLVAKKDISELTFFFFLNPLFILLLSSVFIGDKISASQMIGFVLILLAVTLGSLKRKSTGKELILILPIAIVMNLIWSAGAIFIKLAMNENGYLPMMAAQAWGYGVGAIMAFLLFGGVRTAYQRNIRAITPITIATIVASDAISLSAAWVTFFAYSIGTMALVSVVGGAQAFYCILLGYALTIFLPRIVKEDIVATNLARKIVAAVILLAGLYFVNI